MKQKLITGLAASAMICGASASVINIGTDATWTQDYNGGNVVVLTTGAGAASDWIPNTATSSWIGLVNDVEQPSQGTYSFYKHVVLPTGAYTMTGNWIADDRADLYVNGNLVGHFPDYNWSAQLGDFSFTVPAAFLHAGDNEIRIAMTFPQDLVYDGARMEAQITVVPEASTWFAGIIVGLPMIGMAFRRFRK